jgi:uncharacterized ferritin-like protein (DUF455 family)
MNFFNSPSEPLSNVMPAEFFTDFVSVIADEARHFELVQRRLIELGFPYGSLPVHAGLWEVGVLSRDSLAGRLASVPLVQEARGLDGIYFSILFFFTFIV